MNLILTRRLKEKILIGPDITVTVVRVRGAAVRLSIEAPAEIKILREELAQRMEKEAVAAAHAAERQERKQKETH